MNKIWFLSTCDTCKKIMKELNIIKDNFEFYDLKNNLISKEDLEKIQEISKLSYEDLFNKRSRKYEKGMFNSEEEFKEAILKEYTFLKRPIISSGELVFVGSLEIKKQITCGIIKKFN